MVPVQPRSANARANVDVRPPDNDTAATPQQAEVLLRLEGVTKSYVANGVETVALQGGDLAIRRGDCSWLR